MTKTKMMTKTKAKARNSELRSASIVEASEGKIKFHMACSANFISNIMHFVLALTLEHVGGGGFVLTGGGLSI